MVSGEREGGEVGESGISLGEDLDGERQRGEADADERLEATGGGVTAGGSAGGEVGDEVPSLISDVSDRNLTLRGLMTTDLQRESSSSSSFEDSSSPSSSLTSSSSSRSSSDGMVREIPGCSSLAVFCNHKKDS